MCERLCSRAQNVDCVCLPVVMGEDTSSDGVGGHFMLARRRGGRKHWRQ